MNPTSYLTQSEWDEVKMMVKVLQIPHAATLHFQKQKLTPGECLLHWREVVFKLESRIAIWLVLLPMPCNHANNFIEE